MATIDDMLMNEKQAKEFISQNFRKQMDLLLELREYGLNLLSRCFVSKSGKTLRDYVALGILLKQVISLLDSVIILCREGAVTSSFLPARTLFEVSLCMDWILQYEGLENYYYVWTLRRKSLMIQKKTGGRPEEEEIRDQVAAILKGIEEELSSDEFREINGYFKEISEQDPYHREPEWYEAAGAHSIRDIAAEVSRLEPYEQFLDDFTVQVQSTAMPYESESQMLPEPVRHPVHITDVLPAAFEETVKTYRLVVKYFRPDELNEFGVKYLTEWVPVFSDMPIIMTEPQEMP